MTTGSSIGRDQERYTAVIVDDERQSILNLSTLLSRYCPAIDIVGEADSADSARRLIEAKSPDILFLDIRMPGEDGFALLESLHGRHVAVIFVTAYDQYALRAIKASAVDYLLKPVSIRELQEGVQKAIRICRKGTEPGFAPLYAEILHTLTTSLQTGKDPGRIVLPTQDGLFVQETERIVRLEADGSYTVIVREGEKDLVLSKPLKEFESLLDPEQFARIHNSHIINIRYMQKYTRKDGGCVVMKDGTSLPVSRRRVPLFLEWLHKRLLYV